MSRKRKQLQLFDYEVGPTIKAVSITLYDVSGAPLNSNFVEDLIAKAEEIAQREYSLAISVNRDER